MKMTLEQKVIERYLAEDMPTAAESYEVPASI